MYNSEVYNIMIGAPSDIQEEINIAITIINHWNYFNSEASNIVLMPLHWSISSYPACGVHPQKSINKQLVSKSDLMIAIFGTKIGTPTDTEISGTVEEIQEHILAGRDAMVFFKSSSDDIFSIDSQQFQKIKDFRENNKNSIFWCDFTDKDDFKQKLSDKLQLYINNHWKDKQIFTPTHPNPVSGLQLTGEEKQRLVDWVKSEKEIATSFSSGNDFLYRIGLKDYQVKKGKENAEWEDFFKRLQDTDLIELERYNKSNRPVYKLLKAAYDYVDELHIN